MDKDSRAEFQKFRRKLLKENNIDKLICARCGEWRISIHLHHIKELVYGGENVVENLIPLCHECHDEWDCWNDGKVDFGTFLLTPKLRDIRKVFFGRLAISHQSLKIVRAIRMVTMAQQWSEQFEECSEYVEEFRRQNEIFNTYPYSDTHEMFERYGGINTPLTLEDISDGDVCVKSVFDNVKNRSRWITQQTG